MLSLPNQLGVPLFYNNVDWSLNFVGLVVPGGRGHASTKASMNQLVVVH